MLDWGFRPARHGERHIGPLRTILEMVSRAFRGRICGALEERPRMAHEDDDEYVTMFKVAADDPEDIGAVFVAYCLALVSEIEKVARQGERIEIIGDPHGQVIEEYGTEHEERFVMVEVEELSRLGG